MIKVREVRMAKEVKRSDDWGRFACGDVFVTILELTGEQLRGKKSERSTGCKNLP